MNDDSGSISRPPPASPAETGLFSVTTWNVNSIKTRLPQVIEYLKKYSPDIVLLQEIKTETDGFPFFELQAAGYHCAVKGQKSYNGIAVLSKAPVRVISDTLSPEFADQARYLEVEQNGTRFIGVYVPNGQAPAAAPDDTSRLDYKIKWLDALNARVAELLKSEIDFVLGGDFNVIEFDSDVYSPAAFKDSAFTVPAVRGRFKALYFQGLTNALREKCDDVPLYSYWDYRAGAREKNDGILLDHLFLSPKSADKLVQASVDGEMRDEPKASDHAPVRCLLSLT